MCIRDSTLTIGSSLALLAGFLAVHGWLTVLGTRIKPETFNDIDLYRWWVANGFAAHSWPVFDFPWVYPAGAIAPMMAAGAEGTSATTTYELAWCALVMALDAVAILILVRHGRVRGAWWWLGFQTPVSYTHLRAHETRHDLVCRLLLEKKKIQ